MDKYIGIDIGGTKTAIVIGNEKYEIIDKFEFKTDAIRGFKSFKGELFNRCSKIKLGDIKGVGISVGGPMDCEKGEIYNPTYLPWGTINFKDEFKEYFKVPIKVEHDARAGAYAEFLIGAGRGFKNLIFLTLGTGIGAGIIIDEKKYKGFNGVTGEIGHIRISEDGPLLYGKRGSVEGLCSGGGISLLASEMFPDYFKKNISCKKISELSMNNNEKAIRVLKKSGFYFGRTLSVLIDLFAPDRIILGGLGYRLPKFWLLEALKELKKEVIMKSKIEQRIVVSELKEKIGDYAALITAIG